MGEGCHKCKEPLGVVGQDTVIDGAIDMFNNLCAAGTFACNSDDNFWRSLSNLTLNVDLPSSPPAYAPPAIDAYGAGCANSAEMWSVSGRHRSGGPLSTAASSSRTIALRTTTPAAASSPTARSVATSTSTATSSTSCATEHLGRQRVPAGPMEHGLLRRERRPCTRLHRQL